MPSLTFLGAAGTVTGLKHLLTHGGTRIMIDCGLFQGLANLRELNWQRLPVEPRSIDAVVLTHGHLDHCGYLPRLTLDGFRGQIHATAATRDVAALILRDSAFLQEKDADYANRKGFSKHAPALPLYGIADAERAIGLFHTLPLYHQQALPGAASLLLRRAGHILGAATAQIDIGGVRVAFSGDLGRYDDLVMHGPDPVPEADYVVIESTYGDRVHEPDDAIEALGVVIERTVKRGGTVVVPAFAVGRAQLLIYGMWLLRRAGRLRNVPIYLDSPMATSASDLMRAYPDDHRLLPGDYEAACDAVRCVRDVQESKALSANPYPKVIISASGMATGGRVLHHIAAFAPDHRNTLLFSGFQAAGTRGRKLLAGGARETRIHGRWIPVNAEVAELPSLSAHADSDGLMRWLSGFRQPPRRVFIVHGEPDASEALRVRIRRELGWDAMAPRPDQVCPL
ncbi:MAG TPA: MBL fold metallo-hydrolase [Spongiibacteraceae bacterium]|nr:MBL fold metallo-hydrolase [Spongiibacteraceae bacterium]